EAIGDAQLQELHLILHRLRVSEDRRRIEREELHRRRTERAQVVVGERAGEMQRQVAVLVAEVGVRLPQVRRGELTKTVVGHTAKTRGRHPPRGPQKRRRSRRARTPSQWRVFLGRLPAETCGADPWVLKPFFISSVPAPPSALSPNTGLLLSTVRRRMANCG